MTIISGFIASKFRAVSISVSPLVVELDEAAMLNVSALIRLAAISKDNLVLVEGSKKKLIIVFPRKVGTFFMGLSDISLKERAVDRI